MVLVAISVVLAAAVTGAATWLCWWAGGGGAVGIVPALIFGPFAGWVAFGFCLPAVLLAKATPSIRQAERTLRAARQEGKPIAILRARLELRLARWKRRA